MGSVVFKFFLFFKLCYSPICTISQGFVISEFLLIHVVMFLKEVSFIAVYMHVCVLPLFQNFISKFFKLSFASYNNVIV